MYTCPERSLSLLIHLPDLRVLDGEHSESIWIIGQDWLYLIGSMFPRHFPSATQITKSVTSHAFENMSSRSWWVLDIQLWLNVTDSINRRSMLKPVAVRGQQDRNEYTRINTLREFLSKSIPCTPQKSEMNIHATVPYLVVSVNRKVVDHKIGSLRCHGVEPGIRRSEWRN